MDSEAKIRKRTKCKSIIVDLAKDHEQQMLYSIHPDIFCFSSGFLLLYSWPFAETDNIYIYIGKKLGKGKERYLGGVVAASTLLV